MSNHDEPEEHENHERWLISYADFITLLFAFFVVMYAVSQVDQKRVVEVEEAIRWALRTGEGTGPRSVVDRNSRPKSSARERAGRAAAAAAAIQRRLQASQLGQARPSILVFTEGTTLVVRMGMSGLFEAGTSVLKPSALPSIDTVLEEVGRLSRPTRIEGHADSARSGAPLDDNWALSATRAAAVVAYAEGTRAIRGELLSAVGRGSMKPIASNDTADGRAQNRRIEIIVDVTADGAREDGSTPNAPATPKEPATPTEREAEPAPTSTPSPAPAATATTPPPP